MYILETVTVKGDTLTIPFRRLSKLIEAYKSEQRFKPAQMFFVHNGEKIPLKP